MTPARRDRLAELYVEYLDAGRFDLTASILSEADHDAELAELLGDLTLGLAEDAGFTTQDADVERTRAVLLAARARAETDAPAHDPRSFMRLVVDETGRRPSEIAAALGTTTAFIDDVNDYPGVAGDRVVLRLVTDTEATFGRPAKARGLYAMRRNAPRNAMAASRDSAYDTESPTFAQIVERSGMVPEDADRWLLIHTDDQA